MDKEPKPPRSDDRDFLDRLSDLDRNLAYVFRADLAAIIAAGQHAPWQKL